MSLPLPPGDDSFLDSLSDTPNTKAGVVGLIKVVWTQRHCSNMQEVAGHMATAPYLRYHVMVSCDRSGGNRDGCILTVSTSGRRVLHAVKRVHSFPLSISS